MRINRARRPWTAAIGRGLAVAAALTALGSAAAPKFYDDDPIAVDRDTQDASRIRRWKIDLCVDVPLNLFSTLGDPASGVRAKNRFSGTSTHRSIFHRRILRSEEHTSELQSRFDLV